MRDTFKNIVKEDLVQYLPRIKTPTFLIWGKEDKITPVSIALSTNKAIRNSELIIINGAKHGLPWTNSREFAAVSIKFLKNL